MWNMVGAVSSPRPYGDLVAFQICNAFADATLRLSLKSARWFGFSFVFSLRAIQSHAKEFIAPVFI